MSLEYIAEYAKKAPISFQVVAKPIFANPLEFARRAHDTLRAYGEGVSREIAKIQDSEVMYWFVSRVKDLAEMLKDLEEMITSSHISTYRVIQHIAHIHTGLEILNDLPKRYQ